MHVYMPSYYLNSEAAEQIYDRRWGGGWCERLQPIISTKRPRAKVKNWEGGS